MNSGENDLTFAKLARLTNRLESHVDDIKKGQSVSESADSDDQDEKIIAEVRHDLSAYDVNDHSLVKDFDSSNSSKENFYDVIGKLKM